MFASGGVGEAWLTAWALVTSVSLLDDPLNPGADSARIYDVGLRVSLEDSPTAYLSRRIGGTAGSDLRMCAGDLVPVRYDPADRTRLEVDEDAWRARQQAGTEHTPRSTGNQ